MKTTTLTVDATREGNQLTKVRRFIVKGIRWLHANLFSSFGNSLLTVTLGLLLWQFVPPLLNWLIFDATFIGQNRDACLSQGACWVFVRMRLDQFTYGFYPASEIWRVNLVFAAFAVLLAGVAIPRNPLRKVMAWILCVVFPVFSGVLLCGGVLGLASVETAKWGGLMLTLVISTVGIAGSLPLGILLALGRRSAMPMIRTLSVGFIEFWRGIPLITVLFMASVMLPLFLPEGVTFDKLLRALIGVMLFSAAYMAEVVRGGLQAIPNGQTEAASSLGLSYWQSMRLIVLPQALHKVIPGIVNTFIGLFKDTTLVLIIGMFDLLGIVQAAATDPNWLGYSMEGYVFAGAVFWIFCFAMSRYSQHLEQKIAVSR